MIELIEEDGILRIILNRPDKLNALSSAMLDELDKAIGVAAGDEVRVVVVGARGRAFCAGADLGENAVGPVHGPPPEMLTRSDAVFTALEALPKPVVAAVGGMAYAGGLELALSCDIIAASHSAVFSDAHANFGLLPGAGGSYRLPQRVPPSFAKLMLFTGDRFTAAELKAVGLVDVLLEDDEFEDGVGRLAHSIAAKSPLGMARMKGLVAEAASLAPAEGLASALEASHRHQRSLDYAEGLRAFAEKRLPKFVGR